MTDIKPVLGDPKVHFENDEDGDGFDPATQSVGWAIGWDCQLTFGMDANALHFTLGISGSTQENGVEVRAVTAHQLRDYAFKLAALANTFEMRQRATASGCDGSLTCGGDRHHPMCLGAYRTCDEVESGTVPALEVLVRRRREHVELAQLGRMQAARHGGGS